MVIRLFLFGSLAVLPRSTMRLYTAWPILLLFTGRDAGAVKSALFCLLLFDSQCGLLVSGYSARHLVGKFPTLLGFSS